MTMRTLTDLYFHAIRSHPKAAALRYKAGGEWKDISSEELRRAVEEVSMGLRELGVGPGDRVALLSENRPEWAMVDLAALCAAAVDVPIYPSLPGSQVAYILKDSGAKVLFVSTAAQARKAAEVRAQTPELQHVIAFDGGGGTGVTTFAELRARGRDALAADRHAVEARAKSLGPDDVATIIYTSGTTGDPKGVMLTHWNIVSNVLGGEKVFTDFGPTDVALSFLPLCHIFERMAGHYLMLYKGVTIAYAEGVEQVPANMAEVRPTIMCSVPRLYEKMYARVREKVASDPPQRQKIFHWAVGVGREWFRHHVEGTSPGPLLRLKHALADRLVLSKVRARLGGRLRVFISGGAPLAKDINEFFGAMGMLILEGYGLTETSPVIAVNRPERPRPGTVGPPLDGVEVRIAEDGEILTRGPHVMKGYYNKPEATREAIDAEGWFHTGDIGHLDESGRLVITDRKKDIIVTSGGKNIAPQPIENRLKSSPFIAEVVMIGNRRNFPSALVVPNFPNLEAWARGKGLAAASREELVRHPEVVDHYEKTVQELTRDLASFERIKKIALLPSEFTQDTGELTATLKVKRRVVEEKYKQIIDRLYEGTAA
ncbi:MAG TPA: long-chain fatty acid--CoA ligase [Vicinamibacteria bacterium]|nr:long-chain fatty acid--CoA ligase [Vicinamibacteria bacterium]